MNKKNDIVVNDLHFTTINNPYELRSEYEAALNGELPSDTVRVYVPMDINPNLLKSELHFIHSMLGDVNEDNEYEYSLFVSRLISKIEIYAQYQDGKDVIQYFIDYLELMDGNGDSFPYSEISRLERLRTF